MVPLAAALVLHTSGANRPRLATGEGSAPGWGRVHDPSRANPLQLRGFTITIITIGDAFETFSSPTLRRRVPSKLESIDVNHFRRCQNCRDWFVGFASSALCTKSRPIRKHLNSKAVSLANPALSRIALRPHSSGSVSLRNNFHGERNVVCAYRLSKRAIMMINPTLVTITVMRPRECR